MDGGNGLEAVEAALENGGVGAERESKLLTA